jgi:hypothetical protein
MPYLSARKLSAAADFLKDLPMSWQASYVICHMSYVICITCIGVVSVVSQYNCVYYCDTLEGLAHVLAGVICHMSYVICYMSYVICHMSYVICITCIGVVSVVSQYNCVYYCVSYVICHMYHMYRRR